MSFSGMQGGTGNIIKKSRSLKATTDNILNYPGNFNVEEIDTAWNLLTTSAFYVSKRTVWAK